MLDPTTFPFTVTRPPPDWFGKMTLEIPVIAMGYTRPVRIVNTIIKRSAGPSSFNIFVSSLREPQCNDQLVDQPDPRERDDDSAQPVNQKIAAQHLACADRLVLHAA